MCQLEYPIQHQSGAAWVADISRFMACTKAAGYEYDLMLRKCPVGDNYENPACWKPTNPIERWLTPGANDRI